MMKKVSLLFFKLNPLNFKIKNKEKSIKKAKENYGEDLLLDHKGLRTTLQ